MRLAAVNVDERKIDFVPAETRRRTARAPRDRVGAAGAAAVAKRRQHLYGLHAVRALLERRPETVLAAKVLRDASGTLAELARELAAARRPGRARARAPISIG